VNILREIRQIIAFQASGVSESKKYVGPAYARAVQTKYYLNLPNS
jgi:hypothetical protein